MTCLGILVSCGFTDGVESVYLSWLPEHAPGLHFKYRESASVHSV